MRCNTFNWEKKLNLPCEYQALTPNHMLTPNALTNRMQPINLAVT